MYINVQCKTSWSPLGLAGRQSRADAAQADGARPGLAASRAIAGTEPLVEFNFTGHELDLKRFMQGFRRAVEVLAHEKVRAMTGVTFPVKFTDRLRRLNRITPANKVQSAVIAGLIDLVPPLAGPIFSTLADRRVDLADAGAGRRCARRAYPRERRRHVPPRRHLPDGRAPTTATRWSTPQGRVRGFDGLRVIDASIMPTAPRGNTNIPTIMVAEKISATMVDEARAAA